MGNKRNKSERRKKRKSAGSKFKRRQEAYTSRGAGIPMTLGLASLMFLSDRK